MAYTTTHASNGVFDRVFTAISAALGQVSTAHGKLGQVEALLDLSDAELADRGFRRGDVARYVMLDTIWT
jgi:uncharacterized protein YjiS (DUF1127 family)